MGLKCSQFLDAKRDRTNLRAGSVRHILMKKTLLAGIAALLMATGTAAADDTRKWIWRCALAHTPSEEQEAEAERCCKRWPNAPQCNGDYTRAMSLPRCAKLPHLANIKCAERILLKINPRPR
jgi:hypothetical protein